MKKSSLLAFLFFILPLVDYAQSASEAVREKTEDVGKPKKVSIFEFLPEDSLLTKVVLTTDIVKILENKNSAKRIPSDFSYILEGDTLNWKVDVSPRGKSRRKICDMPPLRIHFSKDVLKELGLKKHNTLKLVSYCKDKAVYNKYILKEYLAYKLLNILTDYSFNVKLFHLEYRDIENKVSPISKYAFLIENTKEMASRLGAKEVENFEMCRDSCVRINYDLFSLFQFMISNTDWNMQMLHNVKIIKEKKKGAVIPIPYDFDYSGFVNTDYSVPNPDYPYQADVRQRIYIGECRSVEAMQSTAEVFILHKKEILDYCQNFEYLDARSRKDLVKYLKKFYKVIEDPKKLKKRCVQRGK